MENKLYKLVLVMHIIPNIITFGLCITLGIYSLMLYGAEDNITLYDIFKGTVTPLSISIMFGVILNLLIFIFIHKKKYERVMDTLLLSISYNFLINLHIAKQWITDVAPLYTNLRIDIFFIFYDFILILILMKLEGKDNNEGTELGDIEKQ